MPILDRRVPTDWRHVETYPLRAVMPEIVPEVEHALRLPPFRAKYDQGEEGACVGFDWSWCMSILNLRFYDARWLYRSAQRIDEWPGENYEGTSVRAGADVLRDQGHCRLVRGVTQPVDMGAGILANRWATTVDEVRTSIAHGIPVALGINWYDNFDRYVVAAKKSWIGLGNLGHVRGGHAICCYGASDNLQAVKLVNSWGLGYPVVWMPYPVLQRLLDEDGEASIITDR